MIIGCSEKIDKDGNLKHKILYYCLDFSFHILKGIKIRKQFLAFNKEDKIKILLLFCTEFTFLEASMHSFCTLGQF